jgi:hypothetical protein
MMQRQGMVSIWVFIGALLLAYGVPILGAALFELDAGIWWGALLILMGGIYTFKFMPGRGK